MNNNNENQYMCKMCLFENSLPGNPLISPCKCKGTMQYVHLLCL